MNFPTCSNAAHPPSAVRRLGSLCVIAAAAALASTGVHAQETFKIGIVSFLSGQAAESFGIPAVNGAR